MDISRHINMDALFQFTHISHSTQEHLKKVYSSLAICMCLAAGGSYVYVVARLVEVSAMATLTALGLIIWLAVTPHNPEVERKRLAMLAGFAFFVGVSLGSILDFVITVDPNIIALAFVGTSVIFIRFTLSVLYAERRTYLFLGGTLMSGLSVLFLMSLINMVFGSINLFKADMYLGLPLMCGFVLFDTQLITEKAENGDKDYIWHCVTLFIDVISIFRRLMIILSMKEKDKKTVSERILCKIIPNDV